jgi:hypothetical protein
MASGRNENGDVEPVTNKQEDKLEVDEEMDQELRDFQNRLEGQGLPTKRKLKPNYNI